MLCFVLSQSQGVRKIKARHKFCFFEGEGTNRNYCKVKFDTSFFVHSFLMSIKQIGRSEVTQRTSFIFVPGNEIHKS